MLSVQENEGKKAHVSCLMEKPPERGGAVLKLRLE